MSSGPTKVIGTLSEFSAMSEDGEEGHSEALSLCPNDECPLHTKQQQQQRPALASPSVPTPSSTPPLPPFSLHPGAVSSARQEFSEVPSPPSLQSKALK